MSLHLRWIKVILLTVGVLAPVLVFTLAVLIRFQQTPERLFNKVTFRRHPYAKGRGISALMAGN